MREIRAQRVHTAQPHFGRDARQGGCIDGDFADLIPRDFIDDRDRQKWGGAFDLSPGPLQRVIVQSDQMGEPH